MSSFSVVVLPAVRTEKSEDLALANVERQAVKCSIGTLPPEANAEILR